jgi:hypothetical protein
VFVAIPLLRGVDGGTPATESEAKTLGNIFCRHYVYHFFFTSFSEESESRHIDQCRWPSSWYRNGSESTPPTIKIFIEDGILTALGSERLALRTKDLFFLYTIMLHKVGHVVFKLGRIAKEMGSRTPIIFSINRRGAGGDGDRGESGDVYISKDG